jgi:hypothetical protein
MTGKKVLGIARQKRACHDHVHAMTKSVRHDITLVMLNEVKHPCAGLLATLGMTKLSSQ